MDEDVRRGILEDGQYTFWEDELRGIREIKPATKDQINKEEQSAPMDLFEELNAKYHFNLDVCATDLNAKCLSYYTRAIDGLVQRWHKAGPGGTPATCWMNPPYHRPEHPCPDEEYKCTKKVCKERGYHIHRYEPGQVDWVKKAWKESKKGCLVVCLLPSRTDTTEIFHKYIWDGRRGTWRNGVKVNFLEGRVRLEGVKSQDPFPSMIVVFEPPKKRKARKKK